MPVQGADRLRIIGERIGEGDKTLRSELNKALRRAVDPFKRAVRREIGPAVPIGYEPVLAGSLRIRSQVRTSGSSVGIDLVGSARGKADKRDLPTIDAGVLRHPVYGRTRPVRRLSHYKATSIANPWVAQPIMGGFWSRPAAAMGPQVTDEVERAVDEVAARIEGAL